MTPMKPYGQSEITAWALKDGYYDLSDSITKLIKKFLIQVKFPEEFKKTMVTPFY